MTDRRDLEPVANDVERVLERLGMPAGVDLSILIDRWAEVAGEGLAAVCQPVLLRGRELTVEVADGPAASLLKYRIGPLLDSLRSHLGEGAVEGVKIRVARTKKGL